jgi:hypothetical protein
MPKPEIKYGFYDWCPVRFTDGWDHEIWVCFKGKWRREVSRLTQLICDDIGVLTEAAYRKRFGDVPPLPPEAFRSGWRSPLV